MQNDFATAPKNKDAEHLDLLAIFHYVVGGISCVCACFPLIYVAMGLLFLFAPQDMAGVRGGAPPAFLGYFFAAIGGLGILIGWTFAICTIVSGRMIAQRRRRTFSIVIAAILCTFAPLGTVLGIFTLIVLLRDSVRELYAARIDRNSSPTIGQESP